MYKHLVLTILFLSSVEAFLHNVITRTIDKVDRQWHCRNSTWQNRINRRNKSFEALFSKDSHNSNDYSETDSVKDISSALHGKERGLEVSGQPNEEPSAKSDLLAEGHSAESSINDSNKRPKGLNKGGFTNKSIDANLSRRLRKLLTGLLLYRAKYGDYMVDPQFSFSEYDGKGINGYALGGELNALLESLKPSESSINIHKGNTKARVTSADGYTTSDIVEAPGLLNTIGFSTERYLKAREEWRREAVSLRGIGKRIKRAGRIKGFDSIDNELKRGNITSGSSRTEQAKKVILEYIKDEYKHKRDSQAFNRKQTLPQPSNRANVRPNLIKNIVSELLEMKRIKNSKLLTPGSTRRETEGGHHYAFYHWSFEDVIECMVLFNDMYMDYNREMLIESEKQGTPFQPITFNVLKPEWRVPCDELWPERFWGLPLGIWLDKFRSGDIDAKEHWLRRDVLDYLQFDWGDGLKYLSFTWDKFFLGLIWYINFRGFPIMELPPDLVVSNAELVAKWGKPEEIQGMNLGYVVYRALDQQQVIRKYYPERFDFIRQMDLNMISQEQIDLGYKPLPHRRMEGVSRYLLVSKDGKYLKD